MKPYICPFCNSHADIVGIPNTKSSYHKGPMSMLGCAECDVYFGSINVIYWNDNIQYNVLRFLNYQNLRYKIEYRILENKILIYDVYRIKTIIEDCTGEVLFEWFFLERNELQERFEKLSVLI